MKRLSNYPVVELRESLHSYSKTVRRKLREKKIRPKTNNLYKAYTSVLTKFSEPITDLLITQLTRFRSNFIRKHWTKWEWTNISSHRGCSLLSEVLLLSKLLSLGRTSVSLFEPVLWNVVFRCSIKYIHSQLFSVTLNPEDNELFAENQKIRHQQWERLQPVPKQSNMRLASWR